MNKIPAILRLIIIVLLASPSWAQEDTEALSKKLANPCCIADKRPDRGELR